MKKVISIMVLTTVLLSGNVVASEALTHSAKASKHSALAVSKGAQSVGKVASVAVAVPVIAVGTSAMAVGSASVAGGKRILDATVSKKPLAITDKALTADLPPNKQMLIKKDASSNEA